VPIRGASARQFLPVLPAGEICDALLPDAAVLCEVLQALKLTLANPSAHYARSSAVAKATHCAKSLLTLAPLLIGSTDVSGLSQLMTECADAFLNTNLKLSGECTDAALRAYAELHTASKGEKGEKAHHAVLTMTLHLREKAVSMAASVQAEEEEGVDEDEGADRPSEKLKLLIDERCLQLTQWALQQEVSFLAAKGATLDSAEAESEAGAEAVVEAPAAVYLEVLPYILENLMQSVDQIRQLAVSCLGLVCLCDKRLCANYRPLILQVALGESVQEEVGIRAQALQSLVDFAVLHGGQMKGLRDCPDLSRLLLRMQESGEPEQMLLAAESSAKLLYAGAHTEARLFANLLKFFFLTESLPVPVSSGSTEDDEDGGEEEYQHRLFLASCARLQQILSLFFHAYTTTDVVSSRVMVEAIPYLVADMTNEVKDSTVEAPALHKILKHLFSLCENKLDLTTSAADAAQVGDADADGDASNSAATATAAVAAAERAYSLAQATAAAALLRELLKLGGSKLEKGVRKEYVKVLASLQMDSWIHLFDVSIPEFPCSCSRSHIPVFQLSPMPEFP
jgi:hypothetical protein